MNNKFQTVEFSLPFDTTRSIILRPRDELNIIRFVHIVEHIKPCNKNQIFRTGKQRYIYIYLCIHMIIWDTLCKGCCLMWGK